MFLRTIILEIYLAPYDYDVTRESLRLNRNQWIAVHSIKKQDTSVLGRLGYHIDILFRGASRPEVEGVRDSRDPTWLSLSR